LPLLPVVGFVCLLILLQPDLGTTMILAGSVFILLFVAGVRMRYLLVAGFAGAAGALVLALSKSYMRARLLGFLHPFDDPQNKGYQLVQSLIALGSGGWTGVGLGASRQKWGTLPNAHTDFIFAILGEELGLLGELAVLALFCLMIYAGIRIAARAPDVFGRLLAAGIVAWLGLQVLVNLGTVTGLLPVTGVPLPLLSFGGSSLVVTLAAVGILISIARTSPRGRSGRTGEATGTRAAAGAGSGR
jgi:cell division protein FtsW